MKEKVEMINNKVSPIVDHEIQKYLTTKELDLEATSEKEVAYDHNPEYVIIAAPTNYDEKNDFFDTSLVESMIEDVLEYAPNATMIIKSTFPVGYTKSINEKYNTNNIVFSPEFLREGHALYDNLHPSRVIVGENTERAQCFADLLVEGAIDKDVPVLLMNSQKLRL